MSIIGLALRMAAVQSLKGAGTLAGARVFDSAFLPIDQLSTNDAQPVISISTEDENDKPAGRDVNAGSRTIDLVIEIAIARAIPLPAKDGEEELVQVEVAESDANIELAITVLSRQIAACLWGRGGGDWGSLFRRLSSSVVEYRSRRGIPVKDGQRLAARQFVYTLQTLAEPAFASPVGDGTPLADFFAAMDADPGLANHAAILREAVSGTPLDWPEFWTKAALDGGYTEAEGEKLGIVDLGGAGAQPLSIIELVPDGTELTEEAADENLPPEPNEQ